MARKVALTLAMSATWLLMAGALANAQEQDRLSKTERMLVRAQRICPVMGKDLTKMGGPLKARVGAQTIFLCCKGCFEGKIHDDHWQRMQANLIAAQGKCPVMGKPLPENPASVVVKGRKVFVCCPPCTKKVEAQPDKYLAIVDGFLAENLTRQASRPAVGRQK